MKLHQIGAVLGLAVLSHTAIFWGGCRYQSDKDREYYYVSTLTNKCLPDAILMSDYLNSKGVPARVMVFQAKKPSGEVFGHAVAVYSWNNNHYFWDATLGSVFLEPVLDIEKPLELIQSVVPTAFAAFYAK